MFGGEHAPFELLELHLVLPEVRVLGVQRRCGDGERESERSGAEQGRPETHWEMPQEGETASSGASPHKRSS